MNQSKGLESVILPGLFSKIVGFLDLETVTQLREQSRTLSTLIDAELENESYWKPEVAKLVGLDLSSFNLNWQKIYKKIKAVGIV